MNTEECASELLEVVPMVMHSIRKVMSQHRIKSLSEAQFRAMRFLHRHPDTSLVDVVEHMRLTPPSVSKLIDGLVARDLVVRLNSNQDRRRIALHLSAQGEESFDSAKRATLETLITKIQHFTPIERDLLGESLGLLKEAFSDEKAISAGK
jgi:DNA-binding MarR family transcriptional regulator